MNKVNFTKYHTVVKALISGGSHKYHLSGNLSGYSDFFGYT